MDIMTHSTHNPRSDHGRSDGRHGRSESWTLTSPIDRGSERQTAAAEKRRQVTITFTKVHGRPPADDAELDTWLAELTPFWKLKLTLSPTPEAQ